MLVHFYVSHDITHTEHYILTRLLMLYYEELYQLHDIGTNKCVNGAWSAALFSLHVMQIKTFVHCISLSFFYISQTVSMLLFRNQHKNTTSCLLVSISILCCVNLFFGKMLHSKLIRCLSYFMPIIFNDYLILIIVIATATCA